MIGLILLNTLILFTKICYGIYKLSEKINGKWGNKEKKLKSNKLIAKLICALIFIDGKAEEEEKEEAYRYIQEDFREKHQSVMKKWLTQYLKEGEEKIANGTYKKPNIEHLAGDIYYDLEEIDLLRLYATLHKIAAADHCVNDEEENILSIYAEKARIRFVDQQDFSYRYGRWHEHEQEETKEHEERKNKKEQEESEEHKAQRATIDKEWACGILAIPLDASQEEVRKAFRKRSMEFHPDRHINESEERIQFYSEKFRQVDLAYSILTEKKS